jgi:hypothetical protein
MANLNSTRTKPLQNCAPFLSSYMMWRRPNVLGAMWTVLKTVHCTI